MARRPASDNTRLFEHLAGNAPVNARAMDDTPPMPADWEQINIKSSGVQSPALKGVSQRECPPAAQSPIAHMRSSIAEA